MTDITTEPDLSDRLAYIWAWQEELAAAVAARNEQRVARASIWLARHRLRLAEQAGHMPVSIKA